VIDLARPERRFLARPFSVLYLCEAVEHSCYKCGSPVEDGTAFCPHCGAAQIRVASEEVRRSVEPGEVVTPSGPIATGGIQWSKALPAAALAGLIAAGIIPLGTFALGMISAGVLAVLFYRRRNPGVTMSPGMGARLGVVSGVVGLGIFSVLIAIEVLVFHNGGKLRAFLLEPLEQYAARFPDPQARQFLPYFKSPPGLALIVVMMFFACLIFSSLSGTLAATLLRRRERS
jgi:hypothetical protein